jgi:hypothetical protein
VPWRAFSHGMTCDFRTKQRAIVRNNGEMVTAAPGLLQ